MLKNAYHDHFTCYIREQQVLVCYLPHRNIGLAWSYFPSPLLDIPTSFWHTLIIGWDCVPVLCPIPVYFNPTVRSLQHCWSNMGDKRKRKYYGFSFHWTKHENKMNLLKFVCNDLRSKIYGASCDLSLFCYMHIIHFNVQISWCVCCYSVYLKNISAKCIGFKYFSTSQIQETKEES